MTKEDKLKQVLSRLPDVSLDLNEEQLDFILRDLDQPCYLKACPGSGKTEVVGLKAAYEIAEWGNNFSGLAVLSFTKNAAKEIANRVTKYSGARSVRHPHYIGTIDAWLHGYILHPFAHKSASFSGRDSNKSFILVESSVKHDFLSAYNYGQFAANEYYYECETKVLQPQTRYMDVSKLSSADLTELRKTKVRFLRDGFVTYPDAEYLCYGLLRDNESILKTFTKRFPYIIIDECQDLSFNQIELIKLLSCAGSKIHLVGDIHQSIYEFKKVLTGKIEEFIALGNLEEKQLVINYRSNQQIIGVCQGIKAIHDGKTPDTINHVQPSRLSNACFLFEYKPTEMGLIPEMFISFIDKMNQEVEGESLIDVFKCAVLARGKTTLGEMGEYRDKEKVNNSQLFAIALHIWNRPNRTGSDMQNALQNLGKVVSKLAYKGRGNHMQQYCPDGFSQIEWRRFLFDLISDASSKLFPFGVLNWSQWSKKLKEYLANYWVNLPIEPRPWNEVVGKGKKLIVSPEGLTDKKVSENINIGNATEARIVRSTTIHDVKGETLDAVILVSSKDKKSKGGHFEHWLGWKDEPEKEHLRFAYVASSRPRHLLIWAIPKVSKNQFLEKIAQLGFVPIQV